MPVEMARQPSPGHPAEIQTDIEPLRAKEGLQHTNHPRDLLGQLPKFWGGELIQPAAVRQGGHQQMAVIVGIAIEHDHRVLAAADDIAASKIGPPGSGLTQEAVRVSPCQEV